jgi:hypothetical protein
MKVTRRYCLANESFICQYREDAGDSQPAKYEKVCLGRDLESRSECNGMFLEKVLEQR